MNCTGIILAGGLSSRMGSDKGLLSLHNKPMIQHVIDTFKKMEIPVLIISNNDEYGQFNCPVFPDIIENKGPVGGIYTGLHFTNTEINIVLSCDTPYVSVDVIDVLIKNHKKPITIASLDGKKHPTIGVFDKSIAKQLFQSIVSDELKLELVYEKIGYETIEMNQFAFIDGRVFANINTPEELSEWK